MPNGFAVARPLSCKALRLQWSVIGLHSYQRASQMPCLQPNATEKLIAALEATLAKLMTHAKPEHRFRFVSAAQSLPYTTAYALWIKNGAVGPQPMASIAEMRAAVYNQAELRERFRARFPPPLETGS